MLITSHFNYKYAKTLNFLDEVLLFPKKGLFNKIRFILSLLKKKYKYIFIFDGKERSIICSLFLKSEFKTAKVINKKQSFFCNLFSIKNEIDVFGKDLNQVHQKLLDYTKLKAKIDNFDYLIQKEANNFSSKLPISNYIQIHLDEKWFNNSYIKNYKDINPSYESFTNFINQVSENGNNIVITTGLNSNNLIERLILDSASKINEDIYIYNIKKNIFIVNKPSFLDLESLLRKARILITCHGAITHAAASYNIKIIDIVEKSRDELVKRYSLYIKNYYKIYRDNFKILAHTLIHKI